MFPVEPLLSVFADLLQTLKNLLAVVFVDFLIPSVVMEIAAEFCLETT